MVHLLNINRHIEGNTEEPVTSEAYGVKSFGLVANIIFAQLHIQFLKLAI